MRHKPNKYKYVASPADDGAYTGCAPSPSTRLIVLDGSGRHAARQSTVTWTTTPSFGCCPTPAGCHLGPYRPAWKRAVSVSSRRNQRPRPPSGSATARATHRHPSRDRAARPRMRSIAAEGIHPASPPLTFAPWACAAAAGIARLPSRAKAASLGGTAAAGQAWTGGRRGAA